jgi:glycerol-3-phosphate dehydrogenase
VNRAQSLTGVRQFNDYWDMLVIGGGATGLATAMDAASRGYKTLLIDMHDFAKGTSSRSTKLVHGGVRYLQKGDVSLVVEALQERGLLMRNAPHLVSHQSFIVPSYEWWNGPFYGVGMKVYDMLAGKLGIKKSRLLSREKTLAKIPTLSETGLRGGVMYYDGQFDDARLAVNMAHTIADHDGIALNYVKALSLLKNGNGLLEGVMAEDTLSGERFEINARVVINATGIFADQLMRMDDPEHEDIIQCSQGIHIVLDRVFLPGDTAIMVPHTEDGRVLFAVPWRGRVIVGTTDTPVAEPVLEPLALHEEVDFILRNIGQYLQHVPTRADIKSVFAGLRPLVKPGVSRNTAEISRSHHLQMSQSGLITIAGGKWTTCRKMAEETVNQAECIAGLEHRECRTRNLRVHGWLKTADPADSLSMYGSDRVGLRKLLAEHDSLQRLLHPDLPYLCGEVIWAVRHEQAMTVEDVLARRTRALLLDARASMECAPMVAVLMAEEMGMDQDWINCQVAEYQSLARHYLPPPALP